MSANGFEDTIRWYNEHAEQYAKAGAEYFDMNHIETFANLLPQGASVLDVGCGPVAPIYSLCDFIVGTSFLL
jgi:hypothetical protein